MPGFALKGALISFLPAGGLGLPSLPNVIVFQINPETMTHAWTEPVAPPPPSEAKAAVNPLAVTGVPGETFSFTLMLDSDLQISDVATDPPGAALALASGVSSRLSALELLQFPTPLPDSGLQGQVSAAVSAAASGPTSAATTPQAVPLSQVPVVLFAWGPLRIVPVRVTAFSVSEKLYDNRLNPTHVEAQITLTVLTPDVLQAVKGPIAKIGGTAYAYMQNVRQVQAALNLAESASNILGMLPAPF
jgi:hypothetical protein